MEGLAIAAKFLDDLQASRNLGRSAFISACGLTEKRYKELKGGQTPSTQEVVRIVAGFNLTDGIPMVPRSQKLAA